MNGFGKFIIAIVLVVIALVFFPFIHIGVLNVDTTGWTPLLIAINAIIPYALLVIVGYVIINQK